MLDQTLRDVRVGLRSMLRQSGFTLVAALCLALGVAAATAMYSVVYAVILDPFPYKDVDRLMSIKVGDPSQRGFRTYYNVAQYLEFRERSRIFEGVIASTISDVVWTGAGEPRRLRGNHGPFDTFDVMGVKPLIGRTPAPSDAAPGAPPVAVLGYRFWQRELGGDPSVIGRLFTLNGQVREVIGVMPVRFMWRGADVYLPIHFRRGEPNEGVRSVHVLGRLKQGVTDAQAEADLTPIVAHLKQLEPRAFPDKWRAGLHPFKETFPSGIRSALWILFGATGLLLLIACANVSNLLLARAAARGREMAVRAALGASRLRVLRQLLTESLLLALAGGALGLLFSFALLRAMIAIVPPNTIPDEARIAMNVPVLLFTLAVSVVTTLLFGLAPALHGSKADLVQALESGARTAGSGRRREWTRNALVVAEVSLSLVLLSGAALMLRTLSRLQLVDLGYDPSRVLFMRVPLADARYPDAQRRAAFLREALDRAARVPGVLAVGVNTGVHPLGGWGMTVEVPGGQPDTRRVQLHQVSPGYFAVYGFRLLAGRLLEEGETAAQHRSAVVNEAFLKRYLPARPPLGAPVRIPQLAQPPFNLVNPEFQIVGVVKDSLNDDPIEGTQPELYFPYSILGRADRLVALSALEPATLVKPLSGVIYSLDSIQPVTDVMTVEDAMRRWVLASPRFNLILFGVFATLGLILAAAGVYGVIAHAVAQRTREIGVRMAMGASTGGILWMVLRRGLLLIGTGLLFGFAATYAAWRLLASELPDIAGFDPSAYAAAAAILLAVGAAACLLPARTAARIAPAAALRNE